MQKIILSLIIFGSTLYAGESFKYLSLVDILREHKQMKPFLLKMIQKDIAYV